MNPGRFTPIAVRLERHFTPEPNSGCWLWFGALTGPGYGLISDPKRRGRPLLAHRVSYEINVGPVPKGLDLDHLCRVRCCINPRHLEAVSRRENLRRGVGFIGKQIARTHCPLGHAYDAINTRHYRGSRNCRECARIKGRARRSA